MKKIDKNLRDMLPSLLVVFTAVFIRAVPGQFLRMLFLICAGAIILFLLFQERIQDEAVKKYGFSAVCGIFICILAWSAVSAGSLTAYWEKIAGPSQIHDASEKAASMETQLSKILNDVETAEDILKERRFLDSKENPEEIERLTSLIEERQKIEGTLFSDIKTDAHTLEKFYKALISYDAHYYINAIRALEAYGIDCKSLSVSEYTLACWDIEMFFMRYSMRQSILKDAAEDVVYEDTRRFYYNDFRISQHQYTDTFDYGKGNWNSMSASAKEIASLADERIMKYYRKFSMNFSGSNIK